MVPEIGWWGIAKLRAVLAFSLQERIVVENEHWIAVVPWW
jgi:galactose-1-phosphate uridylyltransferase